MAGALALLDNSSELYVEIAQAYAAELEQLAKQAHTLFSQSDLTSTARTLHTFKGLSLTIGANAMAEVCRQCEVLCKAALQNGHAIPEESRLIAAGAMEMAAQTTLTQLSKALATLFPATPQSSQDATVQPHDALADLQILRTLLLRSDLQALQCFAAIRARYRMLDGQCEPLQQSINAFDFAEAVVQCDELMRTIGSLYRT